MFDVCILLSNSFCQHVDVKLIFVLSLHPAALLNSLYNSVDFFCIFSCTYTTISIIYRRYVVYIHEEILKWVVLLQGAIPPQGSDLHVPRGQAGCSLLSFAPFVKFQFLQRRQNEYELTPMCFLLSGAQLLRVCLHWFAP